MTARPYPYAIYRNGNLVQLASGQALAVNSSQVWFTRLGGHVTVEDSTGRKIFSIENPMTAEEFLKATK